MKKKSKSYEKVNYLLRFRKQIERKLIIETLQYIDGVLNVGIRNFHYFGLGSIYFADFILFHKYLNINTMTSTEIEQDDEKRFLFNKPFGFINFKICDCHVFLEKELNWNDKLFIWLDYDGIIDKSIIEGAEFVASKAKAGDIYFVTVEAEDPKEPSSLDGFLEEFKLYLPPDSNPKSIAAENFPNALNSIMTASVQNGLTRRTQQQKQIQFLQLFNIVYEDTKKMYTFGGLFCNEETANKLKEKLSALHYISHDHRVVAIDCPLLTPKEKTFLDACIQKESIDNRYVETGLKKDEVENYRKYYKHYPQFFESIY